MYSLLMVDDEKYAVLGVTRGINWVDIEIDTVYEAFSASDARKIIAENDVNVMICDIEMPGDSGLKLLEWVNINSPDTVCIFLTAHAKFSYAQQAISLNSSEYLLKPVEHDYLKEVVAKALAKFKRKKETKHAFHIKNRYPMIFDTGLPSLEERFWMDVLSGQLKPDFFHLEEKFALYGMPLNVSSEIVPILIEIRESKQSPAKEEDTLKMTAFRSLVSHTLLKDVKGAIIQDYLDNVIVMLYGSDEKDADIIGKVRENCLAFITACQGKFSFQVFCLVGSPCLFGQLVYEYWSLLDCSKKHLEQSGGTRLILVEKTNDMTVMPRLSFNEWMELFESGKKDELLQRINDDLNYIKAHPFTQEMLAGYYYGMVHSIFHIVNKKSVSIREIYMPYELDEVHAQITSIDDFGVWATDVTSKAIDYLQLHSKYSTVTIEKAKYYIQEHFSEHITREDIALCVYLNPAYLSRLFKKHTGESLSRFITRVRVTKAKELLENSGLKINEIAECVGYNSMAHFAKVFRKITGFSPREYRNKYEALD